MLFCGPDLDIRNKSFLRAHLNAVLGQARPDLGYSQY